MRITVKRSGGFAGITLPPKVLETNDPEIKALALEVLSSSELDNTIVDGMRYDITIEDGGETKSVCLQDGNEKLSQLIEHVMQ